MLRTISDGRMAVVLRFVRNVYSAFAQLSFRDPMMLRRHPRHSGGMEADLTSEHEIGCGSWPAHLQGLVALLAAGKSNDEISAEQVIEKHTAEKYVSALKQRVGARDRVQLVLWCQARVSALTPPSQEPSDSDGSP